MWNVWTWLGLLNVECVDMVGAECGMCGDGWG